MSRLLLLFSIICAISIEVKCGTLGKISKTEESLMPRIIEALPSNASRLNLEVSSFNESSRNERIENVTSSRQGKFLPKVAFLAGLNIGGVGSPVSSNLASLAKISEAQTNFGAQNINPYIAAMIDPYPYTSSPLAVHQSLLHLYYRLLERIKLQLDTNIVMRNNNTIEQTESTTTIPTTLTTPADVDTVTIVTNRRRKDKLKAQRERAAQKRRKEEKRRREQIEEPEYEEYEDDEDSEEYEVIRVPVRKPSRKRIFAKQAEPADNMTMENATDTNVTMMVTMEPTTVTPVPNTTNNGNGIKPFFPGYYGGNPQQIANVGFTYDTSNGAYGQPINSYGLPAQNYGPPSNSYGPPSNNYGPPSNSFLSNSFDSSPYANGPHSVVNGPSSFVKSLLPFGTGPSYHNNPFQSFFSYVTPHPSGLLGSQDHDSIIYDDPSGNSFPSSDRWPQFPPFARSRKFAPTTNSPIIDHNGFVPI